MSNADVVQPEVFESNTNEIGDKNNEKSQNLQAQLNSILKETHEELIQKKRKSLNNIKEKIEKLRNEYKLMLSDGYIDDVELDNIILEINKINNYVVILEKMLSNPKEKDIISSTIIIIEKEVNKLESIKNEKMKTSKKMEQKKKMINNDLEILKMYISEYNRKFKYLPMLNRGDLAQAEANELLFAMDEIVKKNGNDAEFMLEAIKYDASYIKYAGEKLANNTDFIMKANSINPDISKYLINQEVLDQNSFKIL